MARLLAGVGTGTLLGTLWSAGPRPSLAASTLAAVGGAMAASNAPTSALGLTDVRRWSVSDGEPVASKDQTRGPSPVGMDPAVS